MVNWDTLFVQAGERFPNPLVFVDVEVICIQKLRNIVIDFWVNEYRPHNCFFGFSTVRDCRGSGGCGGLIPKWGIRRQIVGHFFFGFLGLSDGGSSSALPSSSGLSKSSFSRKSSKTDKRSVPSSVKGAGSLFSGSMLPSGISCSGIMPASSITLALTRIGT